MTAFCFLLAFCPALPWSYRVDRGRHLAASTFAGVGVDHDGCPHARAREAAPIPARSEADRPAPAGWAALRLLADVDIILLAELLLADSAADAGARAIGADADVGFAWSGRRRWCRRRSSAASYRVIDNDRKFRSTDSGGALPCSLSAAEQRLGKISGIWPR